MKIYISNNTDSRISWKIKRIIKSAIRVSVEHLAPKKSFEVSVMLVNNAEIHELNLLHRNMDKPTDVLSFPMWDEAPLLEGGCPTGQGGVDPFDLLPLSASPTSPSKRGTIVLGDIVISLEQAQIQADDYGHSLEREVGFLTVHSMLHLFGFDHETSEADEVEMFGLQDEILGKMRLGR